MKRLFVFGCSYTSYSWPSWADLLSIDFDYYENWGLAGIGNRAIAERVNECNIKNKFQPGDTVVVQWSTHLRNDFFHQEGTLTSRLPGWKTAGSIFNYLNSPIYDENWCRTFFDEEAFFMHTLNHISMTQNLLENTGVNWLMTSVGDVRELGTDLDYKREYGEVTIFDQLREKLAGTPEKFGYKISPFLKVYDDPIWGVHKDHWLDPLWPYLTAKKDKSQFFTFLEMDDKTFQDQHFRTSDQAEWLKEVLLPKLNISARVDRYNEIADRVDDMYLGISEKKRFKTEFEKALFIERFNLPRWPNMIKGFIHFRDEGLE